MADIIAKLRDAPCDREPFTPEHAQCRCRLANKAADEIETLRRTISRLRKERPVDWQPIKTAPKNGDELIGFRPDQGVFVFRWTLMEELVAKDMHGDPIEDYDEDQADWWHDRWGWMEDELRPTHWMPLPQPPVEKD